MIALLFVLLMAFFAFGFAAHPLWLPAAVLLALLLHSANRRIQRWGHRRSP